MNETELVAQAMAVLGSRRTDKKRKAAQQNVKRANEARRKPLSQIRCTCTTPTDSERLEDHQKSCLRARAVKRRSQSATQQ